MLALNKGCFAVLSVALLVYLYAFWLCNMVDSVTNVFSAQV